MWTMAKHCNHLFRKRFRKSKSYCLRMGILMLVIHFAACTPMNETEREYLEKRAEEKEQMENFSSRLQSGSQLSDVLKKAQEHPVEGVGSSQEWVIAKLDRVKLEEKMDIPYQNWVVRPKSDKLYEVRFIYSTLGDNYEVTKKGFSWQVDTLIDRVTGPNELDEAELEPSYRRRGREDTAAQTREKRWSLD